LKTGELTHQDIGQMQMYVNYYKRVITTTEENPPIGIILCAKKDNAVVQFTLPEENKQIFVSKYKLYLPTEEELIQELEKEQKALEPLFKEEEEK
jgi:dethiobiotin synthetase